MFFRHVLPSPEYPLLQTQVPLLQPALGSQREHFQSINKERDKNANDNVFPIELLMIEIINNHN